MYTFWIKKLQKLIIFFFFSMLLSGSITQAKSISNEMWNFSFELPQTWKYQQDMNGALLGHDTIPGMILLFSHEIKSMNGLKSEMKIGLNDDAGFLQLNSTLRKIGKNGFVGDYTGIYQMQQVKAKGYGILSPYGGGVFVIAMSTPESYSSELVSAGKSIINSIKYKKRASGTIANSSTAMANYFVGKWSTYTKYSETHIYFYSNGTYVSSNSSSYGNSDSSVGAIWGTAGDDNGRGSWKVQGNMKSGRISLIGNNGKSSYINYRIQGPKMYFNGTLYGYSSLN